MTTPQAGLQLEAALQTLRDRRYRITPARREILHILTHEHGPFSAEDLQSRIEGADLVTVYRTLAMLDKTGLARRCDFGDGAYRYEFNTGDAHHHHVICRACGKVEIVAPCLSEPLDRFAEKMGYAEVTHTLEFFGICPACQKQPPPLA